MPVVYQAMTNKATVSLVAGLLLSFINCSRERNPADGEHVPAGVPIPEGMLTSMRERHHVPGVSIAVVHEGRIDWAKGYGLRENGKTGQVDTATLFQAASISKPVSAVVALRMVEMGKLALDEDANRKLVSWKVPINRFTMKHPVTLRGLLSHSAGLTMHGVPEFTARHELPTLVQILDGSWPSVTDTVRPVFEPGTQFRYSGGGYIILQVLLSDVTRRPFAELAREFVLQPAGMSSSTFEQPLPQHEWRRAAAGHTGDGTPLEGRWHTLPEQAAGGLWTTPRDLASFMIGIWRSYDGKSHGLLSQDLTRQMLTRQIDDFGLGLSLPGQGVFRFQHSGGNGGYRCLMVLSVEVPDGVVIMTNGDSGEPLNWEVFHVIAHAYGWGV
jgi:CubicO group peptidase (beta-lactamase class C family)